MLKKITLTVVVVLILQGVLILSSSANDKACQDLVVQSCTGCHEIDRACDNIGDSKKSWTGLIKYMNANGADLTDEEAEQLSGCMSKPSPGAVAACVDVVSDASAK